MEYTRTVVEEVVGLTNTQEKLFPLYILLDKH